MSPAASASFQIAPMRAGRSRPAGRSKTGRPFDSKTKRVPGLASARECSTSETARVSTPAARRKRARTGVLRKRFAHVDGRPRAPGGVLDPLDPSREHAQAASRALARDRRLDDQARHRGRSRGAPRRGSRACECRGGPRRAGSCWSRAGQGRRGGSSRTIPAAVVGDADAALAAPFDRHAHDAGARVQGVLNQLLHDRGRPLDDLARRDPVGDVVRKDPDARADGGGPRRHDMRSAGESARAPRSRGTRPGGSPSARRASSPSSRP